MPRERATVIVDHGRVTLERDVDGQLWRTAIEHVVRYLDGVRGLNNRIEIKAQEANDEVNHSVESALKRYARLRRRDIKGVMENGVVTLTGDERSLAEVDAAERSAWSGQGLSASRELQHGNPVGHDRLRNGLIQPRPVKRANER